ncbi:RNA methyltransferase [Coleofasciculus sp. FACHB-712]|uniref:RNA methyltransferase n=1 Tax=Coleofasciculus sp. FACHB-712 TaxID=2692789 RepID=UPI001686FDCD|nr:RNA methyltransferase [Coleofasciculus sp. FACHB-712]MBD1941725.1 RNA methyltransferase [Coleofasciculus sp. FACHB-712]
MDETRLAKVRIVLVEPAGPLNVGSVARAMKNMGLRQLVLVNPQCDRLSKEATDMAVHAIDVLESAQVVATIPEALQGCVKAIATTTRSRTLDTPLENPRIALPWLLEEPLPSALLFGPEDRGLSNLELNYAQRFVRITTNPEYPSLNLAQAVGICCYELYQNWSALSSQSQTTDNQQYGHGSTVPLPTENPQLTIDPVSLEVLEGYYQQMEAVLLKMGYLYPHTAGSRMEKFRRLFNRANPSKAEVAMLRGIFSQMDWALQFLPHSVANEPEQQDAP